ncbi:MAG: DUF6265 family protein [Vicinamibacterales bacterium]
MKVTAMLLLVALAAPTTGAAQQRPDFSGTWSLLPGPAAGASIKPAPAPGFGPQITIRHEGTDVIVSRILGGQTLHVRHPTDGSETRIRVPGALCEGDSHSLWTASWEADTIVTTWVASMPAGASAPTRRNIRSVFRLVSPDTMTVDVILSGAGLQAGTTTTIYNTTYKRTGAPPAGQAAEPAVRPAKISQVEWLGGTWLGASGASVFEERWTPPAGGSMLSVGRTLRNGVMNAFEFLCIVERNGGLVYSAMPNGRQPATDFRMTAIEATAITFENPAHDFPKMIRYTLKADGTLEAVVSGDAGQKPQVFTFRKQ